MDREILDLSVLQDCAIVIVETPNPIDKVSLVKKTAERWRKGELSPYRPNPPVMPDQPGRPEKPELLPPSQMPRRRLGSPEGLIALIHSLVHIEMNAIDMTWDLIARFAREDLPREFLDDAVKVGLDEAEHFELLNSTLEDLGAHYGDLPGHKGFWEAAHKTRHYLLARLAIGNLVLEARGLDVSPNMIRQIEKIGQPEIAETMRKIYVDEITHVAFGAKWFKFVCHSKQINPEITFQNLVRKYFHSGLKSPFNDEARAIAGLTREFYEPLALRA
jgi:uncharacterized ferritin-like protein (DUF455 family)